jgi:Icc-related predicted phosphoesterase
LINLNHKSKKLTFISDTHATHQNLIIPTTDFLIHCGDAFNDGNEDELKDFFKWFSEQEATYKIFVAGNHDLIFDLESEEAKVMIPKNIIYLENNYMVIDGISFYSVSARLWLHLYPLEKRNIDFLITHGPGYSVLDLTLGCKTLLKFIENENPKYHLFGHIHEMFGLNITIGKPQFINAASILN